MRKVVLQVQSFAEGKGFYFALALILLSALVLRTLYLEADAPLGITKSQDFSTDPFQYIYFAKNLIDHNESNPLQDPRFSQWEKSSQNLVALAVFSLSGTGRAAGNLVGVVFNLLSILLLALALRHIGLRLAALIFALFAAFDFTLIWFGRTPFLEASQNFWLCLSVYFFARGSQRSYFFILAGVSCAAAAFFGKMIALYMVGAFAGTWVLLLLLQPDRRRIHFFDGLRFSAGFTAVAAIWGAFIYLPSRGELAGYVAEQALGLYGSPKALESVNDFLLQLVTLLSDHDFFVKMPLVTILAFAAGAGILVTIAAAARSKEAKDVLTPGLILLLFWFAIGYLSLFPWNYRPLRYQTTIMFPALALAGVALAYMIERVSSSVTSARKPSRGQRTRASTVVLALLWGVWLLPLVALVLFELGGTEDRAPSLLRAMAQSPMIYTILFVGIGAVLAVSVKHIRLPMKLVAPVGFGLAVIIVVYHIGSNSVAYARWVDTRQYSLVTADRDLGAILNDGAVISGSYATALTQENKYFCLVHMFGVVRVDSLLFEKYPVTHLAVDEGNEQRARQDYPDLMNGSHFVTRYILRGIPVRVYRISAASPNSESNGYQPTDYEISQQYIAQGTADSAQLHLQRYLAQGIPNYSANLYVGDALQAAGDHQRAVAYYHGAQEFSVGDGLSAYNLANCYMALGGKLANAAYFDSALVYYKVAYRMFPSENRLVDLISQLERRR